MDSFLLLCKTRAAGAFGPANLTLGDIKTAWEMDGWQSEAGMPLKEFINYMLALNSTFISFTQEKNRTAK